MAVRVSTVVMPSSALFKISRYLPTDNLYSNNFLIKTSSNIFWPFKEWKNPIFKVIFNVNKAEHAVQSYAAGKGNITTLSNTEQTRAMQRNAKLY